MPYTPSAEHLDKLHENFGGDSPNVNAEQNNGTSSSGYVPSNEHLERLQQHIDQQNDVNQMPWYSALGRHAAAETLGAGANTINSWSRTAPKLLQSMAGYIPGVEVANYGLQAAKKLFNNPQAKELPTDYYAPLGVQKNLADEIVQGGLEYAPFGAGAARAIPAIGEKFLQKVGTNAARQGAAGAVEGMVNAPEGEEGAEALKGGLLGTGIGIGGQTLATLGNKAVIQPLAKWLAQSSTAGALKKLTNSMRSALGGAKEGPEAYAEGAQAVKAQHENLLGQVGARSQDLDTHFANNGRKFSYKPYTDTVNDFYKKYNSADSVGKAEMGQAEKFITNLENNEGEWLKPTSFKSAIDLNKNLNAEWKKYAQKNNVTSKDHHTIELINDLKDSLHKTISHNIEKTPYEGMGNELLNKVSDWRKIYAGLKNYEKTPDSSGTPTTNKALKNALLMATDKKNPTVPESGIMTRFLPQKGDQGSSRYEQLSTLVGSKNKARKILKSYYLSSPLGSSKTGNHLLDFYEGLHPEQRDWLFKGTPEGELLETAHKSALTVGRPYHPVVQMAASHGLGLLPGAGLGYGLGALAGEDNMSRWRDAALLGLGGGIGAHAARKAANPERINKLLKLYQNGANWRNPGSLANAYAQQEQQ